MNKLLAANFSRMKQDKVFWLGILFMFLSGIAMPVMHNRTMQRDGYTMYIDNGFFVSAVFIGIILSIFCSLFVGTEYSDGTIRNKVAVGQKRAVIYLSNLITCIAAGIFMCAANVIPYLCVGIPLLGSFQADMKIVAMLMLCILILSTAFCSLYTFIAMLNQSKAGAAVICILSAFLLLFAGTYISARLQEPETYDSYTYLEETGEIITGEPQPNPSYLRGTKREIYEFLFDFLPGGQSLQIANMSAENPWMLMLYSGLIIVGTTGAGLWAFRKKDLK